MPAMPPFAGLIWVVAGSPLHSVGGGEWVPTMVMARRQVEVRKAKFLATLACELRDSLAPIRNALDVLERHGEQERLRKLATEVISERLGYADHLVDDLLDASRIQRGVIQLRRERIEIAPIVHEAIDAIRPECEPLHQDLTLTLPAEPMVLDADPARLAQILGNLLDNATRFTGKGGRVSMVVERDEGLVVIRVRDTGIGIAPEHIPRIFEMFTQVEASDGLGLGLPLVKTLVELQDGTIEARSAGVGMGSEFVLRFPLADVQAAN